MNKRTHNRRNDQLRPISVTFNSFTHADASILLELGKTTVLCSVTLQQGVPRFLKGKGTGWLSAEYAMLPTATVERTQRACTQATANGRSVEISRVIGRVLRTVTDVSVIGERTLLVDCDILRADGGTRTASIIAASIALHHAQKNLLTKKEISMPFIKEHVAAVSVGIMGDALVLDPDYQEDSFLDADLNFIMTQSGMLVEIQGGAEKNPLSWDLFDNARALAQIGIDTIFTALNQYPELATTYNNDPIATLKKHFMHK